MPPICLVQCSNALMAWSVSCINCELYLKIKFIIKTGICGPPAGECRFADVRHHSWHPQYGSSLSDIVPGLCNANASDVVISTKWCPTAGGLQRLYFTVYTEKALPRSENNLCISLRNDLDFQFCAEVSRSPVATLGSCFSRRACSSLQGEVIRHCSIIMLH